MSPKDARKAVEMKADAIMVSNHGGRQLDGGRSPFDQLDEILQEVGGEIEVILDGGIQRGTHVLKAMARELQLVLVEECIFLVWLLLGKKELKKLLVI